MGADCCQGRERSQTYEEYRRKVMELEVSDTQKEKMISDFKLKHAGTTKRSEFDEIIKVELEKQSKLPNATEGAEEELAGDMVTLRATTHEMGDAAVEEAKQAVVE